MSKKRKDSSPEDKEMWTPIGSAVYEINGRKYHFDIRSEENGGHFAWCKSGRKWAGLYPDVIIFENEGAVLAKCLEINVKK